MFEYEDLLGCEFEHGGRGPERFDCWGLCLEVCRRAGLAVPAFSSPPDRLPAIHREILRRSWLFERIERPEPFCLVTFAIRPPYVTHVGVVMEDRTTFLHILKQSRVTRERLDHILWKKKIAGFYRW